MTTEPILVIPGMMSDARAFGPQIDYLSAQYTVHVANTARGDSIREMAANLLYMAPPRFALCGHDLGGAVAMEVLRRAPERVTRLCLISTSPLPETPEQAVWREPQIVRAQAGKLDAAMAETFPPECFAPGPYSNDAIAIVGAMATRLGPEVFVRQSRAMQRRPDAQKELHNLRVPSLILCGEHDKITPPKRHMFMAELIPYAEIATIDDAGHFPMLETPQKTSLALEAWMDLPPLPR